MDTSFLCGVWPRLLGDTCLPKKRRQPVSAVSASGSGCEGSEHFLQFGLAIHIGQDRSLLDGVVVLVEGECAGDAVDGAGSDLSAVFVGSGERDVIALSKTYLVINGSCYWVLGLLFIYRFTLQGLGNGWVPTVAGIMELVMRATAAVLLVERLGFAGASSASPLAWIGACIPLGIAYYLTIRQMVSKQPETTPVKAM